VRQRERHSIRKLGPADRTAHPDTTEARHHVADGQAVEAQMESQRHEQVSIGPKAASTGQTRNWFRWEKSGAADLAAVGERTVHPCSARAVTTPLAAGISAPAPESHAGRQRSSPGSTWTPPTGQLMGDRARHTVDDRVGDDLLRHDDLGDPAGGQKQKDGYLIDALIWMDPSDTSN
jgi:hypothetical protein